jgi:hypothetical protein
MSEAFLAVAIVPPAIHGRTRAELPTARRTPGKASEAPFHFNPSCTSPEAAWRARPSGNVVARHPCAHERTVLFRSSFRVGAGVRRTAPR